MTDTEVTDPSSLVDASILCEDFSPASGFSHEVVGNCHKSGKHIYFGHRSIKIKVEKVIVTGYWLDRYPVQVQSLNFDT